MGIISQLFGFLGCNQKNQNQNHQNEVHSTDSHFDKYKKDLDKLGLQTMGDLENLVISLIQTATKIEVNSASPLNENSQFKSHFGSYPYFEYG